MNENQECCGSDTPACEPYPTTKELVCRDDRPTVLRRLVHQRESHEAEIARIDAAVDALGKNPDVADCLNKVSIALGRNF